ncbi:hypothetical protein KZP23_16445 [Echinicola marina]|uniref:hypothetical protein n=1 Tax=Echinicola marina TaxID=2859768 RepID=UPI001CF63BE9|nr:hypothetical protein [Echinicola marina]UCS92280.1 hypothetical protein KZP23_16445 [Echinicola marina]
MKALSAEWMKLMRNNAINSLYSKMDIKLETTRGYYNPSFLKLTVNADCDLSNLNLLNKAHFSTFYHEYIHFLQDLTTTFGVTNAAIIANRLRFYNEQFRNSPDQFVKVKIPLIDQNGANSKLNAELQNLYQGTGNLRSGVQDLHILSVAICDSNIFLPDPFSKYAKGVRVCIDLNGSTETLQFGGICILENIAHILQEKFFGETHHPSWPYRAAEYVALHIHPQFASSLENVLALCEASLMSMHSGETFVSMLEIMKAQKYLPENASDVYDFVLRNVSADSKSLIEIFQFQAKKAKELLGGYFTTDVYLAEKKWLDEILSQGESIRLKNLGLFLEMFRQHTMPSAKFIEVFGKLGTPFMMNINGDAWFHPPQAITQENIQPDRLAAIMEIFNLFENGTNKCDLKHFCMINVNVDERCNCSPWKRWNDSEVCAYGALWKTWGLFEKEPI